MQKIIIISVVVVVVNVELCAACGEALGTPQIAKKVCVCECEWVCGAAAR